MGKIMLADENMEAAMGKGDIGVSSRLRNVSFIWRSGQTYSWMETFVLFI